MHGRLQERGDHVLELIQTSVTLHLVHEVVLVLDLPNRRAERSARHFFAHFLCAAFAGFSPGWTGRDSDLTSEPKPALPVLVMSFANAISNISMLVVTFSNVDVAGDRDRGTDTNC